MALQPARLEITRNLLARRSQRFRWKLIHANGRVVAVSGEGYANRAECVAQAVNVVGGLYAAAARDLMAPKPPPIVDTDPV